MSKRLFNASIKAARPSGASSTPADNVAKEFQFDAATRKEENGCSLGNDPERLDQVVYQRWFVVVVGVKETDERIEASQDQRPLDLTVKHAVRVVQHRVKWIDRRSSATALEFVLSLGGDC